MSKVHQETAAAATSHGITPSSAAPPAEIPPDYVGEFVIPGSGRRIWWTGRVAIGLRYQAQRNFDPPAQSSLWIQRLMLGKSAVRPLAAPG
jgi:hypothetical protein